jgi:muramoyltetrapeptide carboxypeptidase
MILRPGDAVAIIAPAAQLPDLDAGLLDDAASLLEEWGLRVSIRVERTRHFYLAGPDRARALHLQAALADPATRAIFAARGGYGSTRLFSHLAPSLAQGGKILVGYSDITALHLAARHLWPAVELIHGPNIASLEFLGPNPATEANRLSLQRALFDPAYEVDAPVEFLRPGQAAGPLFGGCLSLVAAALGSRFSPVTDGAILFLEDTDEAPYRIDRLLVQLRNAGLFSAIAGAVFGVMHKCADGMNDLRDIIRDVLADSAFPIAFGLPAGHGETNIALPLGAAASLDSASGRFRLRPRP